MASLNFDTELMTNMIAATPVAARSSFSTFLHPTTRRPAVLGMSSDQPPKLELIAEDAKGYRRLHDFGKMLGIPAGTVQCFAARQDSDLQIYAIIAYKASDTESKILILKPFSLSSLDKLPKYEIQSMPTVEQFFMGPVATSGEWPLIVASHKRFDRNAGGSDLTRILVYSEIWQKLDDFKLPENASNIVDVCAGSTAHGRGVWVLYVIQGETRIVGIFAERDRHGRMTYQQVRPNCPVGANSVESYVSSPGTTSLLIGAQGGLYMLSADNSIGDHGESQLVCSDLLFRSPLKLDVAQDGKYLTLWSVGRSGDLGYVRTEASLVENSGLKSTLLMPSGSSSGFSATISRPEADAGIAVVTQSLISNDTHGQLSWLQQNTDTGIWKTEPFVVSNEQKVYEVQSYTISIAARDEKQKPVSKGSIKVTADSTVQAWVNGQPWNISSEGTRLPLDLQGELNLIVSTSGIAGRVLHLEDLQDHENKGLSTTKTAIDPSHKVMQAFASIDVNTDLTKVKTKSGASLFESGASLPSASDLKQASKCFNLLNKAMREVSPATGLSSLEHASDQTMRVAALSFQSIGDKIMDGFHWVIHKIQDAVNWIVEKVGQVWTFACEIAGEVKRFVLDCVEKVGQAATWVWEKIKLGIDKLIEFAGFLFNWDDIKTTRNTIATFLNAGLSYGSMKIKVAEDAVDKFFVNLEQKISTQQTSNSIDTAANKSQTHDDEKTTKAQNSTAFKWMTERLKNGGAATGMSFSERTMDLAGSGDQSFDKIFAPIVDSFSDMVKDIAGNLKDLFSDRDSFTNRDLWAKLGKDFLKDGLKIVKNIVLGILKLADGLLSSLNTLGNKKINIPVISWLWKKISGNDLTLFDAISLILGFMTCTLSKLVTGSAPPTFSNLDATFIDKMVKGEASDETKRDLAKFGSILSLNVTVIIDLFSVFQFFTNMVSKGTPGTVKELTPGTAVVILKSLAGVVGLISAYPTDPKIPGYELRKWAVYMGATTIGSTALFTFTPIGGPDSQKKLEIFNCVISLVNFGLYSAVYAAELDENAQFEGKDKQISGFGIVENVFATVMVAGRCVAFNAVDKNPLVAGVALAVMHGSNRVLTVNKGLTMKRAHELKSLTTRGVASPT